MRIFLMKSLVVAALLLPVVEGQARINVVTTIPDFGAIASEIGGDLVEVTSLVKPTQDPHFVDAKPSFMLALNQADLLLVAGMELEGGWLPPLISGARNRKILRGADGYLNCSTLITPMEVKSVDRAQGDIHPGGNPHYWIDPRNGLRIAKGIAEKLAIIDPDHASMYSANLQNFSKRLQQKIDAWQRRLAPFRGTAVVVYHHSWIYFLDWSGFVQVGTLEPKPGIPPKASHVASLIEQVKSRSVRFMLQESFYPTRLSSIFAAKTGATLKVVPTMVGAGGTHSYIELIDVLVKELTK